MFTKKVLKKIFHFSLFTLYNKIKRITQREKVDSPLPENSLVKGWSEKYNLILIHNPKAAGTSLMNTLEIPMFFNHQYPLRKYTIDYWESNRFLLVVRHPLDRLVSAYFYHTGDKYFGGYLKLFPNLKSLSFYEYFKSFAGVEHTITPQYNYTYRPGSEKKIDFLLKFESLEEDLKNQLGIESKLPKKNQTIRVKKPILSSKELNIILAYYNIDFEMFGYPLDDFHLYIEVRDE